MKVKVLQPFQVSHDGVIYRPGDEAQVPGEVGAGWARSGWCVVVEVEDGDPDLSALGAAVGHLEEAGAELEDATSELDAAAQTAGPAAAARGRSGSGVAK